MRSSPRCWPAIAQLEAGLDVIRRSPADNGRVELIVRRPAVNEREVLDEAELDGELGLVGDTWNRRASRFTTDKRPDPDRQLALIALDRDRWGLAGDQLYVDLDTGAANLPPGTRLAIGSAVIEVTRPPHTGCGKFAERFGLDALRFVNSPVGKELRLRGINAKVLRPGAVRTGDAVRKAGGEEALRPIPVPLSGAEGRSVLLHPLCEGPGWPAGDFRYGGQHGVAGLRWAGPHGQEELDVLFGVAGLSPLRDDLTRR